MRHVAIVLAAGRGNRMKSDIPKQFLHLKGKPVLYYSLAAFENSFVDEIILVTGKDDISYCKREIAAKYGLHKVKKIVAGGEERYLSVYQGLLAAEGADFVYIHDGARPLLTERILLDAKFNVEQYSACAAGMPVKDTIKITDKDDFAVLTPDRRFVWQVQTPQVFAYDLVREAYEKLLAAEDDYAVTDDAMVVETMLKTPVKLFAASYENMKITTPEDLDMAEVFLERMRVC